MNSLILYLTCLITNGPLSPTPTPRKPRSPWRTQSEQCSPSAARPGRRSLCPLAASAQPLFSPLSQPAVTERATEWCAPPRCPAWPHSWQTPPWTSSALGAEKPSTVSALVVSVWRGLGQGDELLYITQQAEKPSTVSALVVSVWRGLGQGDELLYITQQAEKPSTVSALVVSVWRGLGQGDELLYITQQAEKPSTVSALVVCGERVGWDRVMCFPHKRQQTAEHWPNTHSLPPPPPPCTHSLRDINSSALTDYIHTTHTHTLPHKTQQTVEHWHYTHSNPPPTPPALCQKRHKQHSFDRLHPHHTHPLPHRRHSKQHSADTLAYTFTATAVSVALTSTVSHQSLHTAVQFVQLMVQGFNLLLLLLKPLQHTQTQRRPPLVTAAERAPTSTEGSNSIHSSG